MSRASLFALFSFLPRWRGGRSVVAQPGTGADGRHRARRGPDATCAAGPAAPRRAHGSLSAAAGAVPPPAVARRGRRPGEERARRSARQQGGALVPEAGRCAAPVRGDGRQPRDRQRDGELWPVSQTAGRFETETRDGADAISAKNADRYAPVAYLVEGLDTKQAVALYVRFYPLLQRAYEELGYPGRYFNDRVVEVIDNLLATPSVTGPVR